jgi:hypothetical protein
MKTISFVSIFVVCSIFAFSQTKGRSGIPSKKPSSAPAVTSAASERPKTLAEFKHQFLNQQVVINDVPFEEKYCLQWNSAQQKTDGSFAENGGIDNHLAIGYRGQTGTVIVIQLAPSFLQKTRVGGSNAFGESISERDVSDPYMEVVVKFEDGALAITRGYTITLVPELMELASKRQTAQGTIESQLPSVIGLSLYAVGFSHLYKPTTTIDELTGIDDSAARMSFRDVPLLVPLTIVKAKYVFNTGAVLLKLKFPSGSEGIAYTPSSYIHLEDSKQDFLSHISGSLLSSIPSKLTPREIKAIKEMTLFRGMSEDAVNYAIGFKDSENDWGRGGKQRIYFGGKLVVYIDSSGKVQDWQSFE